MTFYATFAEGSEAFASPKSIFVFGSKKSWFEMPAKPEFMLHFMTMESVTIQAYRQ